MDPSLLEPSLRGGGARPLYSTRACFYTGFFGGAYAAVIITGVNSWRAKRPANE